MINILLYGNSQIQAIKEILNLPSDVYHLFMIFISTEKGDFLHILQTCDIIITQPMDNGYRGIDYLTSHCKQNAKIIIFDTCFFDWKKYVKSYSDLSVLTNKEDAWNHWQFYGKNEGRNYFYSSFIKECISNFDWKKYVESYSDLSVLTNKEDAWNHWQFYGKPEGRTFFTLHFENHIISCYNFIQENYKKQLLFYASDNPSKYLLHYICQEIIICLNISNSINYCNIICFLTVNPSELFYHFIKQLPDQHNIYICIDDDNYNIPNYDNKIKIIKINHKICEDSGFKSSILWLNNKACSRDKALYYFCKNNIEYDNIWFIEEDVFIPSIYTIQNLNNKYIYGDLLVKSNDIIYKKCSDWHWSHINSQIKLNLPYSSSLICAIRCSKKLLQCINDYVGKYNNLFMDEALFNTIALHNNLNIVTPKELCTILWRGKLSKCEINENNLYHPVKSMIMQHDYRIK